MSIKLGSRVFELEAQVSELTRMVRELENELRNIVPNSRTSRRGRKDEKQTN